MSNNFNEEYEDQEFPIMTFMISRHPDPVEQIPVMALLISHDEIIEMDVEMLEKAINPIDNQDKYKPRIVAKISTVNKRDALAKVIPSEGVLKFFIGAKNSPIVDKNSIEIENSIGLIDASISINDFTLRVEKWMDEAMEVIEEANRQK